MKKSSLSRIITGIAVLIFSVWFIFSVGFVESYEINKVAVFSGIFFIVIGVFIIFNKKEDDIEKIKDK